MHLNYKMFTEECNVQVMSSLVRECTTQNIQSDTQSLNQGSTKGVLSQIHCLQSTN